MANVSYSRKGALVGALILAVGLILLLDQLGYVSAGYVFRFFWPAIFIFFGIEVALCRDNPARVLVGVLMILFGLFLTLGSLGILHVGIYTMWPLLLIIWGVWVIARALGHGDSWKVKFRGVVSEKFRDATGTESPHDFAERVKTNIQNNINYQIHENIRSKIDSKWGGSSRANANESGTADNPSSSSGPSSSTGSATSAGFGYSRNASDSEFDYMAIFGGIKQRIAVKNFRGGRLMAICGGFEIDLTRADIEGHSAVIDASALMGGGEIRVPETWIVEIRGVALLGGYTDETHQMIADAATAKHLIVKGIAALGGVVIKN